MVSCLTLTEMICSESVAVCFYRYSCQELYYPIILIKKFDDDDDDAINRRQHYTLLSVCYNFACNFMNN